MHVTRLEASRAFMTAGSNSEIRAAMIEMTTSSSMRVKPGRGAREATITERMGGLLSGLHTAGTREAPAPRSEADFSHAASLGGRGQMEPAAQLYPAALHQAFRPGKDD